MIKKIRPCKKGKLLAFWRVLLHGYITAENGKKCAICLRKAHWGYRCCWECERFHLCYPKWKKDRSLGKNYNRYCPYAREHLKWCSRVRDKEEGRDD